MSVSDKTFVNVHPGFQTRYMQQVSGPLEVSGGLTNLAILSRGDLQLEGGCIRDSNITDVCSINFSKISGYFDDKEKEMNSIVFDTENIIVNGGIKLSNIGNSESTWPQIGKGVPFFPSVPAEETLPIGSLYLTSALNSASEEIKVLAVVEK
jgi:hypothetical protein